MNSKQRRINLSGIHAVNWYGYTHDYIPVTGNFLLAGVMGSGKSIIMDLIQHVLVGNEKCRYNASATGATSGRSFKGYCLGDLKTEVNDVTQFFRPKGTVTFIALEFTWPDGERKETWGFRAEWANALQNKPARNNAFFVPTALGKHEFLHGSPAKPLDYAAFRELVKAHAGTIFDGFEQYRKEMANSLHLNFDRDTVDYLLPSAMSFTLMSGGFNRFCRRYILPEEPLKTDDVRDSYLAFQKLEADLLEIQDKVRRLEQIKEAFEKWSEAKTDVMCLDYLQKDFAWRAADEAKNASASAILKLETENAVITQKLSKARLEKEAADSVLVSIMSLFNATPDGAVFLRLKDENQGLVTEIERLKTVGKTVSDALQHRLKLTRIWLDELKASPFKIPAPVISAAEAAYANLAGASQGQIRESVRTLATAIGSAKAALETGTRELRSEHAQNRVEMTKIQTVINGLKSGNFTENATLLTAINNQLPPRNGHPAARALRQLCEVNDERWRAALEVVFGQKFAVVVSEEDYKQADEIFYELKANASTESLVIPSRALKLSGKLHSDSLASKLDTDHPIALAFVNHYLGDIICVERREDMLTTPTGKAVMPDGYQVRGAINARSRHYDNRPYIGARGIERQKGFLQDQYDAFARNNQLLQPSLDTLDRLMTKVTQGKLTAESIHDDLSEAARLPVVEKKLMDNIALLNRARAAGLESLETEFSQTKRRIKELEGEIERLIGDTKLREIDTARKRQKELEEQASNARVTLDNKISEIGAQLVISRKDELASEISAAYPSQETAAAACRGRMATLNTELAVAWEKVLSYRREMADKYTTMKGDPDYEIEADANDKYAQLLERMAVKDMDAVRSKAARERINWHNLFRTTVASKLNSALSKADDLIALMKTLLCRPIGNHEYHISKVENPEREYIMYRKLLTACAASGEEGDLFAALETDVRKDIEELFDVLVKQPDSRTALQFLDYRNYHDYDLKVGDVNDPASPPISVDRQSSKMSGGENQSPYFISILACYLRAYRRHVSERSAGASLCLVPIDEAFSKMSGDGIRHSISALRELGLQGFLSMSSGNIPYAIDGCDQVLTVTKKKTRNEHGDAVRNIAVSLTREEALQRYCKR